MTNCTTVRTTTSYSNYDCSSSAFGLKVGSDKVDSQII